jgi:hypothetical protein
MNFKSNVRVTFFNLNLDRPGRARDAVEVLAGLSLRIGVSD